MRPEITKQNGATTIDAIVKIPTTTLMRTSTRLASESMRFLEEAKFPDGKIRKAYYVDPKDDYCLDCTSCLNVMGLLSSQIPVLKIKVDGEDEVAERIALRLYSALASEDSIDLDFYRFEKE